jgi:hypothetical protein
MKKRFSDEQIISILREAEPGFQPVSSVVTSVVKRPSESESACSFFI